MVVSYNLLSKFVDLSEWTPEMLVDRLTFAGFEVEGVNRLAYGSKVISGKIIECQNHPDSDHLHLLKVDCGGAMGVIDIVCGAPNARQGIKVIVALPGCDLPAIGKTIKAGVILNHPSNGMCCSLLELGVPEDLLTKDETDGIHELDDSYEIGDTQILKTMGLDDTLLDVNVLPNRPDALSLLGFAREVSALTGARYLGVDMNSIDGLPSVDLATTETKSCCSFLLCDASIDGFDKEAADKIAHDLLLSGYKSVSPLVDVGNFAMVLTGQPFHIYDKEKCGRLPLHVRDDYEGDFLALNDKTYQVRNGDIVISNSEGHPLCLGGVMGSKEVMVSDETKDILIESASFYHANIRHTCARLGLSSASSLLYSKGVNPLMGKDAIEVFLSILLKVFPKTKLNGRSLSQLEDELNTPRPFAYSLERTNHRLGSDYTEDELAKVLGAFRIIDNKDGTLTAPKDRLDLKGQADIDEEIFRFHSADRISQTLDGLPLTQGKLTYEQTCERNIRNLLVSNGLHEIMTFTLVDEIQKDSIRVFEKTPSYRISNPLTNDHEYVRVDLLPSMVETMEYNISHKKNDLAFFEISSIDSSISHKRLLSIGLNGNKLGQDGFGARPYDFYDLSGYVEAIFSMLGIQKNRYTLARSKNEAFHPGMSADIVIGKSVLGTFGALNPAKFSEEYLVCELDLGAIMAIRSARSKFVPFGSHPSVSRDLSFTIKGNVEYKDIVSLAKKNGGALLKSVKLFDNYHSGIRETIGIKLVLEGDHTLSEGEINEVVGNVVTSLIKALPLELNS